MIRAAIVVALILVMVGAVLVGHQIGQEPRWHHVGRRLRPWGVLIVASIAGPALLLFALIKDWMGIGRDD